MSHKMIVVPAKKAHEVNLTQPLKQFIQQTYSSNLDDYMKSADALNQLRNEALFKANRQEKLAKLMRYYDQLCAIETKLPISENQIRIPFKWADAFEKGSIFGRNSLVLSSNLYERLCVLFNIGATCSDIASTQQLDTEDGLKTAAKYFQLAASCYSFIRDNALTATRSDCTSDLYPDTLSVLISIMLAQAQEVFYHKAVKDKMKDLTTSKIAAQCSDYYADAMKAIQNDSLKDMQKMWLTQLAGKQALYHAMSEYHRSEHDNNDRKCIGEALARLGKALELIKLAEQRGGKELSVRQQISIIQSAYDKTKKDNEFVYHDRVPDYKQLPVIERAALAKVGQVKFPLSEDFRDLFSTLVPITVHNGLQTFKAKKIEAFNLEIGKLRQATELLNAALATWNLPASIEDASGLNKVPQSLLDKSQIIKDKGGISRIDHLMSELPSHVQRNAEILNVAKKALEDEEKSDTDLRTQMREKWTRTPSRQLTDYLHSEIRQYETLMDNALKANKIIEKKYKENRDGIQLLSKPSNEIATSLPAATPVGALQNTHVVKELRRLIDEVEGLKSVREVLESEMKQLDSDALNAKLVSALQASSGLDEHSIIQNELEELVGPIRKQVKENIHEQEKLLGFIEKANSEFNKEKVQNETSKMREEMLKNLAKASDTYNELHSHLEEGTKFYNDLTPLLLKFQSKVDDFVFARKTEKEDLMKDIQTSITRAPSAQAPARPPPPAPSTTPSYPSTDPSHTAAAPPPPAYPGQNAPYPNAPYPTAPNPYFPMPTYYPFYGQQPNPSSNNPFVSPQPPQIPPRK